MKKIILSLAACAFIFAGCSDSETLEGVEQNNELLNFTPSIGKATRASEFTNKSWEKGNKFTVHAYQHKPTGWTSYFAQELEKGESSWTLNGDRRYRLPYASKFISIFPQEAVSEFKDNDADFENTFPSVKVKVDKNGYYPDLIASVTNIEALETKVDMKFHHLLSQVNIGVEEFKDAKITITDIKFTNVPSEGTYQFSEPEGQYGYWSLGGKPTDLVYPFSKENSFTTTGLAANGSYIFGDGGNYAAGDNYKYIDSNGEAHTKGELSKALDNSMMVLPTSYKTNETKIEFTYSATDLDGNPIGNKTKQTGTITPQDLKVDWKQNYRYLYMIKFDFSGNKLTFTVGVGEWENYNGKDEDGMVDADYDTSTTIPMHIYPNDPHLSISNDMATYTIPTDILPKETETKYTIALIFDDTTDGAKSTFLCKKINVAIPTLPINFPLIKIDASSINSTDRKMAFAINNQSYTGTVSFVDYYKKGKAINIGAFDFNMPNGSTIISNGYIINGDMNANNGLVNLDGTVTGTIYAKGNANVGIKSGDSYNRYATTSITENSVSKWYGFGFRINDIVGIASPGTSLPDFLNLGLGLNYAGAYANFNFNNQSNGFSWKEFRNLRYDFYGSDKNVIAQSQLKNDLDISKMTTPGDLANYLNMPVKTLKKNLKGQVAKIEDIAKKYAAALPGTMSKHLMERVNGLKASVDYFCNKLPTANIPNMPNLPIATFVPASDNTDLADITKLVGKPDDKFELGDIPGYINGSKPLTLFMLVNFFNEMTQQEADLATLEAEMATLKARRAELEKTIANHPLLAKRADLVTELAGAAKPSLLGGKQNSLYKAGSTGEFTKNYWNPYIILFPFGEDYKKAKACNDIIAKINEKSVNLYNENKAHYDEINEINDRIGNEDLGLLGGGLTAKIAAIKGQIKGLEDMLTLAGIDPATVKSIKQVITAISPYLATTANVLNSINTTVESIKDKNPWEYPIKASSKTQFRSMSVEAKFEYATSKFIYVTK